MKYNLFEPLIGKNAIEYLEERLTFSENTLLKFPKYFLIETINSCNARCIMCGIDFSKKKTQIMDDSTFYKIVDEVKDYTNHIEKMMLFLDGEPLLDKKLENRLRALKDIGIKRLNISSNASLLDEKRAYTILDSGLDEIHITIDSLKKEVYEKIRVGLNFEKVLSNTHNFIKIRDKINPNFMIRVQMILQDLNYKEENYFKTYWKKHLKSDDQIVIQKAHNWGSTIDTKKFSDENIVNNIPCIALWGTLVIHVDGTVPLCCMDTQSKYKLGDINKNSIKDIWENTAINTFRNKHLNNQRVDIDLCNGCTLWRDEKHLSKV